MKSLLHDLMLFIQRDFTRTFRRPQPLNKETVNNILFGFWLLWAVATIVLTITFWALFGWGWAFLLIPGILVAVGFARFIRFHADKYGFCGAFG